MKCSFCKNYWSKDSLLVGHGDEGQVVCICPNCRVHYSLDVCTKCCRVVCQKDTDRNHVCKRCQRQECTLDQMTFVDFLLNYPVEITPLTRRTFMMYVEPEEFRSLEKRKPKQIQYGKGMIKGYECKVAIIDEAAHIFMRPSDIAKLEKEPK